jgi:hypothetical protein
MAEPLSQALFVDDPKAPEFFASSIVGLAFDGPNIRLTFASTRVNHAATPGPTSTVVNARIVMSLQAAQNMRDFLTTFLKTAELNALQKPQDQSIQ